MANYAATCLCRSTNWVISQKFIQVNFRQFLCNILLRMSYIYVTQYILYNIYVVLYIMYVLYCKYIICIAPISMFLLPSHQCFQGIVHAQSTRNYASKTTPLIWRGQIWRQISSFGDEGFGGIWITNFYSILGLAIIPLIIHTLWLWPEYFWTKPTHHYYCCINHLSKN